MAATIAVLVARAALAARGWRHRHREFCSAYVNAGNLGLPIAAYALGDAALIAPMLLAQLLILQPSGLAVLDAITYVPSPGISRAPPAADPPQSAVRNPLAVGSLIGLVLALTGFKLPVDHQRASDSGRRHGCAIHAVGVRHLAPAWSAARLRRTTDPNRRAGVDQAGRATDCGLPHRCVRVGPGRHDLLAVTVIAALPTAQNIFTFAMRYDRGVILARDMIFVATLLSVPVILIITWLLAY